MEVLATITALLTIANVTLDLKSKIKDREQKQDLGTWLLDVSTLLQSLPNNFRNGIYPYAKCSQLEYFLTNIKTILAQHMNEEQLQQLVDALNQAYQIERLFGELQLSDTEQRELNLKKLEEASGTFLAAGQMIKLF